jgi:hypothetical protein
VIYSTGDRVTLNWSQPLDGAASVTVTDPAGLVTTIAGIPYLGAMYAATFIPLSTGHYTVAWASATKTLADSFDVAPATSLITVATARQWLRLKGSDTVDDGMLAMIVATATSSIEDITGPMLPRSYTETYDGGENYILPDHQPLLSVQSVTEFYGTTTWLLTEQPLGLQTSAYGFTVDYDLGAIMRRTYGGGAAVFNQGEDNIRVSYTAGRRQVPEAVQLATAALTKHIYDTTLPTAGGRGRGDEYSQPDMAIGFAVPNFVMELLQPFRRPPGVA